MANNVIDRIKITIPNKESGEKETSEFDIQAQSVSNSDGSTIHFSLSDTDLGSNDRPIVYDGAGHILIGKQYTIQKTIKSSGVFYGFSDDSNSQPSSWSNEYQPDSEGRKYIWVKTITEYSDGAKVESTPIAIPNEKSSDTDINFAKIISSLGIDASSVSKGIYLKDPIIDSNGVMTGSSFAINADYIQSGKVSADHIDVDSLKSKIINADTINTNLTTYAGMFSFHTITDIGLFNEILAEVFRNGIKTLDYLFAGSVFPNGKTLVVPDFSSDLSSKKAFYSANVSAIEFGNGSLDFDGVDNPFGNATSVTVRSDKTFSISGKCGRNGIKQGYAIDYTNVNEFSQNDLSKEAFPTNSDEWLPKNINASINIESHEISKQIVDSLLNSDGNKTIYFDSISGSSSYDRLVNGNTEILTNTIADIDSAMSIMQSMNSKTNWEFIHRMSTDGKKFNKISTSRIMKVSSSFDSSNLIQTITASTVSFISRNRNMAVSVDGVAGDDTLIDDTLIPIQSSSASDDGVSFTINIIKNNSNSYFYSNSSNQMNISFYLGGSGDLAARCKIRPGETATKYVLV